MAMEAAMRECRWNAGSVPEGEKVPELAPGRRKTCVITGATSGLGFEVARQLAAAGMNLVGIGRSEDKCRRAESELRKESPGPDIRFVISDLSALGQVRAAAETVKAVLPEGRLDCLVHNAATVSNGYIGTEDGYELQFAVNYLSAFLLTRELFPYLSRPREARVITMCSGSHRRTRINWDDPMLRKRYGCLKAYKQSKLALVLFTVELNRRIAGRFPIRALGIEPGLVDTALGEKNTGGVVRLYWRRRRKKGLTPAEAAASVVRLAMAPAQDIPQDYWRLWGPTEPSPYARRVDSALRLWQLSEKLCGVEFL
jgi:NAD(P)-dependent dehydrogenase (short-subunit alcohol dehydrogenase family)